MVTIENFHYTISSPSLYYTINIVSKHVNLPIPGGPIEGTDTVNGHTYDMAAEVGIVSRNIKVKGYDEDASESFGGRVLVARKTDLSQDEPTSATGNSYNVKQPRSFAIVKSSSTTYHSLCFLTFPRSRLRSGSGR